MTGEQGALLDYLNFIHQNKSLYWGVRLSGDKPLEYSLRSCSGMDDNITITPEQEAVEIRYSHEETDSWTRYRELISLDPKTGEIREESAGHNIKKRESAPTLRQVTPFLIKTLKEDKTASFHISEEFGKTLDLLVEKLR